jgi:hypothetical protein
VVKSYSRVFELSYKALVNDDTAAFGTAAADAGVAAAACVATAFATLLAQNSGDGPTLADSSAMFTTTRINKASSGTDLDVTNIGVARQGLRNQKTLDGVTPIAVRPTYLVFGPAKETKADQALATLFPAQASNANPFAGGVLEPVLEPRITGNAWYLFGSNELTPTLEYAYLSGRDGPQLELQDDFNTRSLRMRVWLDVGVGAVGWRGSWLNAGA